MGILQGLLGRKEPDPFKPSKAFDAEQELYVFATHLARVLAKQDPSLAGRFHILRSGGRWKARKYGLIIGLEHPSGPTRIQTDRDTARGYGIADIYIDVKLTCRFAHGGLTDYFFGETGAVKRRLKQEMLLVANAVERADSVDQELAGAP